MIAKPFLKWAGGKTQLLGQLEEHYPKKLIENKIDIYVEPFIGSGAVFFDVIQKYDIKECFISDLNPDLVLTYNVVKFKVEELIGYLKSLQDLYQSYDIDEREKLFYEIRENFNSLNINDYDKFDDKAVTKAGYFIFLNKTCFNGLFRVNSKGLFNVPFGKFKNPPICNSENLRAVSSLLQNTKIYCGDYQECFSYVTENTFVYFDPPYRPLNPTSSFTAYTGEFNDKHQIELAQFYTKLACEKNALLMLSNSDPKNHDENDNFFDDLYSSYNIYRVFAKRAINSKGSSRGAITEILVTNY